MPPFLWPIFLPFIPFYALTMAFLPVRIDQSRGDRRAQATRFLD